MTEKDWKQKRKQQRNERLKYVLLFFLCGLILLGVLVPLPYYVEMPGTAENVQEFVSVDGKRNTNDGSFMLTTVALRKGTIPSLIAAKIIPFQEVIKKEELMGDNTDEEYAKISDYQMSSSENMAKKVAFDLVKEPYDFEYIGIYVMGVTADSNFSKKLKTGDIVNQIDGTTFKSTIEFMDYVKEKKVGDTVEISFIRDGKTKKASGDLIELPKQSKAGLGITLVDHSILKTAKDVSIKTEDIGGPSAGLMFTLELYELLSQKDLRKGREIAGTGTISSDGSVGSIGGIDKKVVAANKAGAEIFFAPDEEYSKEVKKEFPDLKTNYEIAKEAADKINTKMKIVPVKTVQDALDYLEK